PAPGTPPAGVVRTARGAIMRTLRSQTRTRLRMTDIRPDLSEPLSPLRALAMNLRWAWHAPTRALFERLVPSMWPGTRHNPLRLLADVSRARLDAGAAHGEFLEALNAAAADLERYLHDEQTWFRRTHPDATQR